MDKSKNAILVVDDELQFLDLMREILEEVGYKVYTAESGERGIETCKENGPISIILTDQNMRGMSGVDFLSIVKDIAPDTLGILVSGSINETKMGKLVQEGAVHGYLTKPIDIDVVLDKIEKGLKNLENKNLREGI